MADTTSVTAGEHVVDCLWPATGEFGLGLSPRARWDFSGASGNAKDLGNLWRTGTGASQSHDLGE